MVDEERIACAYLLRVAEPPARALAGFVGEVGMVEAAKLVRGGDVPAGVADEGGQCARPHALSGGPRAYGEASRRAVYSPPVRSPSAGASFCET